MATRGNIRTVLSVCMCLRTVSSHPQYMRMRTHVHNAERLNQESPPTHIYIHTKVLPFTVLTVTAHTIRYCVIIGLPGGDTIDISSSLLFFS